MNAARQLRVLYRNFLFRLVDVELLSSFAGGDSTQLLGQFAAAGLWQFLALRGRLAARAGIPASGYGRYGVGHGALSDFRQHVRWWASSPS